MPSSPAKSRKKFAFSVVIKIFVGGPVFVFFRGKDWTVAEGQDVTGKVLLGLHPPGDEYLVPGADAHQALVKGPVAQAAEGKAIRGSVVVAFAPGFDVCGLDNCVALWRGILIPHRAQRWS